MADAPNVPDVPEELASTLSEAEAHEDALRDELGALEGALRDSGAHTAALEVERLKEETTVDPARSGRISDVAHSLRAMAARQWKNFVQEVGESRDVLDLLRRRLSGDIKSFSPAERDMVRAQIADVFRVVPATALALAPVPGIAVVTPFLLKKLNLLPSAWREAGVISRLDETARKLEAGGETEEAARVRETIASLRHRSADREERVRLLRQNPDIRVLYDFNMDGEIDDAEWATIKADRAALQAAARDDPAARRWYFSATGRAEGPVTLGELRDLPLPEHAVVTTAGLDRWVPLELLLDALES